MKQNLGLVLIAFITITSCGYTIYKSFGSYVESQSEIESMIAKKATKIRTSEFSLSKEEIADLLLASSDRVIEKTQIRFYMYVSLFVMITFFGFGFFTGRKAEQRREPQCIQAHAAGLRQSLRDYLSR